MIRILLFAQLKDQVGENKLLLDYQPLSVADLKKQMQDRYKFQTKDVMVAINEEYAADYDMIHDGDVVAMIPPVSGG
ncbi:MoaD/ThiS family protein [Sporolactobacillus shoreae]|uniref:Molybdopterin synthase sulfur carrier subunit n=1 Tax=Sporolactobacillus shoreae TaxID=1465501 RepID=A0A4Z0GTB3_9BACL|nr:MoaD/ThiS family protein [Sporolactobacillus shoreae]TGA99904.1 MoaD/ThiS family protein [Sporolactobacillus shoreae]